MKRKYYQMERKSRTAYRRYRLHKVKKNWVVKSSVIGAMILGGSSSASAIEAADTMAIEQAVDPTEDSPAIESEITEQPLAETAASNEEIVEQNVEQSITESEEPVVDDSTEILQDEEIDEKETAEEVSTVAIDGRKTPLEEKVDVEIVQPALNMAQTVQNEPEIAALIASLLQAQQEDTVNYHGGVTVAADALKAAVTGAIETRNVAVDKANAAINRWDYRNFQPDWTYQNFLGPAFTALLEGRTGATSTTPTVTSSELETLADEVVTKGQEIEDEIFTLGKPGPLSDQGGTAVKTTITYRYIDRSGKK